MDEHAGVLRRGQARPPFHARFDRAVYGTILVLFNIDLGARPCFVVDKVEVVGVAFKGPLLEGIIRLG